MIELIVKAEEKATEILDAMPWYGKLLLGPEYSRTRRALTHMRKIRTKQTDSNWFEAYAGAVNDFYDGLHDVATAGFHAYEKAVCAPYFGDLVRTHAHEALHRLTHKANPATKKSTTQVRMPTIQGVAPVIEAARKFSIETLAADATSQSTRSIESYRTAFTREYTPKAEGYWMRDAALELTFAVGSLLEMVFGETKPTYTT